MGLSFADLATISKEPTALYPEMSSMPVLSTITDDERTAWKYQDDIAARLRRSAYYIVEETKSKEPPRYSDKYRIAANTNPTLKESDLYKIFFPSQIWDAYFHPKTRKKGSGSGKGKGKLAINFDELESAEARAPGSPTSSQGKGSGDEEGEQAEYEDEEDDDYNDNYFDNGEGADDDDVGGGGDEGGGDYD